MKEVVSILILGASLLGTASAQISTNGLVRDYPFTGNANDRSVNALNGTVTGATLTTDRFGTPNAAYSFNGTPNNYITIPPAGLNMNEYTYSAWLYLSSYPMNGDRYFALSIGSSAGDQFINYNNNVTFATPIINGWGGGGYNTNHPLGFIYQYDTADLNQWYHLVVTRNTNTIKTYVNNVFVDSIVVQSGDVAYYGSGALSATVGLRFSGDYPFHGKIDDLRLYNRSVTPYEISALYNENICKQTITVTDTLIINGSITGYNPITYNNTIKVYPNPTKDHLIIDNGNLSTLVGCTIKITNALGQTMFTSAINQQQFNVNLASFTGKGVYFIYIIDAQGSTTDIKKVVLQ
ncbi:MAG: T9SS type A sorting domain-containing protein [Bacteroidia bacterium]|nr:T9SS type A sorting domain-containing protein [Bacteroidia bacterium]